MISTMKKIIVLFGFVLFSSNIFSQQLIFCEGVDADGVPSHASHSFEIATQGSFLYLLVKMNSPLTSSKIIFDIFSVDSSGKEKFESSTKLSVQPGWTWFKNGFTFYKSGNYNVYVYTESEKLIVSGRLALYKK